MACGIEFRQPSAEVRKLWIELRILNDSLFESVGMAQEYLANLDTKVSSTKAYFVDIRNRIADINKGEVTISGDLARYLLLGSDSAHEHFEAVRSEAAEVYAAISEERSSWMDNTSRLMARQLGVLDAIDKQLVRHNHTLQLRARVLRTYGEIVEVNAEVQSLQKVLYDCEVGKADLEEDYILLVKSYQQLAETIRRKVDYEAEA